ncbi:MAG TPA: sorbosone dehydrogenase family protein [Armatimonadota bacterium]
MLGRRSALSEYIPLALAGALCAGCSASRPARALPAATGDSAAVSPAEGRPVSLPPPFATPSANNGPRVVPPPVDALPKVPAGYTVALWTADAHNPRNVVLAPNGDVFVVESNRGRVRVFRPAKGDYSKPGEQFVFAQGLRQPFGLTFYKNWVYIGDTDAVVRFPYKPGQTKAVGEPQRITELTPGGYNQHWTRNVLADVRNNKLFVSVGSRTNVDPEEPPRASILQMNPDGSARHTYASGLRNPVGLAINPDTGRLWTAVNERDNLGDDLPPDFVTEVKPGGFYGWPYAYIGPHEDPRRKGERPDLVAKTIVPDVLVGAHVAALNLAFNPGRMLPGKGDAFVALHGSWNRARRDGYSVIRIPVRAGRPAGPPSAFLTGFVLPDDNVWGRPVGICFLPDGSLLVSEDGNDLIYRVTYGKRPTRR